MAHFSGSASPLSNFQSIPKSVLNLQLMRWIYEQCLHTPFDGRRSLQSLRVIWKLYEAEAQGGHGTAEYTMVQDFLACIREDTPPPIDIHAALRMALPGMCAHQSALQGGQMVEIPDWES